MRNFQKFGDLIHIPSIKNLIIVGIGMLVISTKVIVIVLMSLLF